MNIELKGITWSLGRNASVDQLEAIPEALAQILSVLNGFILWNGALHIRGLCDAPSWHSLQAANDRTIGFQSAYRALVSNDLVFAEDCVGDQFFLREGNVYQLYAETGDIDHRSDELGTFLSQAVQDPIEFLGMQPLLQLQNEGADLEPGELIHAFPPFCTEQAASGVSLRAIPSSELHSFHADFAAKLGPDGSEIEVEIVK